MPAVIEITPNSASIFLGWLHPHEMKWNDCFSNCCSYCFDLDDNNDIMTVAMIVLRMMILMAIMMIVTVSMIAMIVLRMILTLEGFLHLSISRLTAGRPPWTQQGPSRCTYLQR